MEITTNTTTIFFTLLPTPLVRPILTDLSRPLYECLDCGTLTQAPILGVTGGMHFSAGEVWDDIEERLICDHCHGENLRLVRPALDNQSLENALAANTDEIPF